MESRKSIVGSFQIYSAFFLAGTSIIACKILGREVNIIVSVTLSLFVALIILIPVHIKKLGKIKSLSLSDIVFLGLQAVTGIVLTRYFTLRGLTFTTSINAGLITSLTPALMAIASLFIFKEKLLIQRVLALVISIAGVVVINYGEFQFKGRDALLGSLLILLSVISEVAMSVIKKYRGDSIHPLTNTVMLYFISLVCFLPLFLLNLGSISMEMFNPVYIATLLYYGIFGSALAYICWSSGVVKVSGFVVSQALTMIPLTVVILAAVVLNEEFTSLHLLGSGLVLVGSVAGGVKKRK